MSVTSALTPAAILEALRPVQDPELRRSLVELNMIRDIRIESDKVAFTLVLTTPACPLREMIVDDCKAAIRKLAPVDQPIETIDVTVTAETLRSPSLPDRQSVPQVRNIIAVSSGKGGVGKTSVAVNMAVALAQTGARVGILDADIYGPNVPQMLGLQDTRLLVQKEADGTEHIQPLKAHGIEMISMALLIDRDQPVIWRGPMLNGAIRQFLYQVEWSELDYLIVDMPPGTGDAQLTLTQAVPIAGVVIVTTPQTVALLDARKGLNMFRQLGVPVLGIVENMSYFIPPDQPDRQYDIFGSRGGETAAQELQVPLLGRIPLEIGLREAGDNGIPMVLSHPESASAQALTEVAKVVAGRVSMLAYAGAAESGSPV